MPTNELPISLPSALLPISTGSTSIFPIAQAKSLGAILNNPLSLPPHRRQHILLSTLEISPDSDLFPAPPPLSPWFKPRRASQLTKASTASTVSYIQSTLRPTDRRSSVRCSGQNVSLSYSPPSKWRVTTLRSTPGAPTGTCRAPQAALGFFCGLRSPQSLLSSDGSSCRGLLVLREGGRPARTSGPLARCRLPLALSAPGDQSYSLPHLTHTRLWKRKRTFLATVFTTGLVLPLCIPLTCIIDFPSC